MTFWASTTPAKVRAPAPASRALMSPDALPASSRVGSAVAARVVVGVMVDLRSSKLMYSQVTGTTIKQTDRLSSDRTGAVPDKPPNLRERRAQLTRDEILRAARRLFAERGYPRTSVRDVAEAAGVSAQTVYDSIGSKQALVARLQDLIDSEAGIAGIVEAARASRDP